MGATEAIDDLPIQGGVSRPRTLALAQLRAGRIERLLLCRRRDEKSQSLCQAGVLLTLAGTVSLCYAACAISDRVVAAWIRPSPQVVVAPVAVAPSSA
jgi:hypothetical protein